MKTLLYSAIILCFTLGCKKDSKDPESEDGAGKTKIDANWANKDQSFTDVPNFSGTFTGRIIYGSIDNVNVIESEIQFDGSTYKSDNLRRNYGSSNDYIFGAANGTFVLKEGKTIQFNNSVFIYPAIYDGPILQEDYAYKAKGDSLILNKLKLNQDGGPYICQYRLKRMTVQ